MKQDTTRNKAGRPERLIDYNPGNADYKQIIDKVLELSGAKLVLWVSLNTVGKNVH